MILMGGQKIAADEAYAFGLVDRVVEPDRLMPTAHELVADSLAADPRIATGIAGMCR